MSPPEGLDDLDELKGMLDEMPMPPPPPAAVPKAAMTLPKLQAQPVVHPASETDASVDDLPVTEPIKTESAQVSAQDLTADIFGDGDFELPPAPAAKPMTGFASQALPAKPVVAAATPFKPATPFPAGAQNGAFKPVTPAFSKPGVVAPSAAATLSKMAPTSTPAPVAAVVASSSVDELRLALSGDVLPSRLPAEALTLAFQLCRLLVKKGVVDLDELLASVKQ